MPSHTHTHRESNTQDDTLTHMKLRVWCGLSVFCSCKISALNRRAWHFIRRQQRKQQPQN